MENLSNSCLESTAANTRFDHTSLKVRGVDTCFKNINLCDQHPVCDNGEDEVDCFEEYKEKGLTPKDATQQCQSIDHNEESVKANLSLAIVMIEAVPCDGNPTCWKNADESFCDNDLLTIWIPGRNLFVCAMHNVHPPFLRPSTWEI